MRSPIPAIREAAALATEHFLRAVERAAVPDLSGLGTPPEDAQPHAEPAPAGHIQIGPLDI